MTPSTLGAITILGSGRLGPTLTALLGLAGAALAVRALARLGHAVEPGITEAPRRHPATLPIGLVALGLGVIFLAAADSGPGGGDGVVASGAAIAFGLVAIGLDRVTARRTDQPGRSDRIDPVDAR